MYIWMDCNKGTLDCVVVFCFVVWFGFFFSKPHKQNKPEEENVLESIQEKGVLSKVAVLSWRNFCCCAGSGGR